MIQSMGYRPIFSLREDWAAVTPQLDSCGHCLPIYSQPDPQRGEPKPNLEGLMMKFMKTQMATNETLKESQLRQEEMITPLFGVILRLQFI